MGRLIAYAARNPWRVLLALTLLTVSAATRLGDLNIHVSAQGMMLKDDPARALLEHAQATYGGEDGTVIFLHDRELFTPENLAAIKAAVSRIEALPFVSGTASLYSAKNVKSRDGSITARAFLDPLPETPQAVAALLLDAHRNPLIKGNLLSSDARSMAIRVYFRNQAEAGPDFDEAAVAGIEQALADLESRLEQVFQISSAFVSTAISEKIRADQRHILPWSLAVLLLALALTLRRLNGAVVPLLTASLSIVWTLGLMAAAGIPINVMTSIVPALLIIIGSTEDIHLLAEYYAGTARGLAKSAALAHMGRGMGTAVLLTFITTYLGFVSIATNQIGLLQQFGLVASSGLLLNFLITTLLVPAWLQLTGRDGAPAAPSARDSGPFQRLTSRLFHWVQGHRRTTAVLTIAIVMVALDGASLLRVNNDPMGYFGEQEPLTLRAKTLQENLAGIQSFSIILRGGIEGTFLKTRYLRELSRLQAHLAASGQFDKTLSFADFIAVVNAVMEEDESGAIELPESDDIVREYMLFIQHRDVAEYVSPDFSEARVVVRHNIGSSHELNRALAEVQAFIDEQMDPGLEAHITGESILTNHGADYMAIGQAKSLLLMVLVIWLIVSLLFVNAKAGLLAVLPNLFPIVVLFGVMGYAGIPLDTGTTMIAAIALGICVDDTMHFMVRYHHYTRLHGDQQRALFETVRDEALPIVSTSVALALGFGVLALSGFPPVVHFGLLSAMVMLLALLSTFVLAPVLLSSVRLITLWDILSLQLKNQVLERCELFRDMRPWQVKKLVLVSEVREFRDGQTIVRQGDLGDEMFVILDGGVNVDKYGASGTRTELPHMSTGEVFGEMALVSHATRSASVSTRGRARVLVLKWDGIHRIARLYPRISSRLFLNLSAIISRRMASSLSGSLSFRDTGTGAFNKAYLHQQLAGEIERASRYDEPLALVTVEMERFRHAPDSGQDAADETMLRELVHDTLRAIRKVDVLARSASNRLTILLPRTGLEQAKATAARLCAVLDAHQARLGSGVVVRSGVAEYARGDDVGALVGRSERTVSTPPSDANDAGHAAPVPCASPGPAASDL